MRTVKDVPAHTHSLMRAIIPTSRKWTSPSGRRLIRYTSIVIASVVIALAFLGWLRSMWRAPTPAEYAFACYIGICYLWPYPQYPRFFWPVVPLILYYACTNFTELQPNPRRFEPSVAIMTCAIVAAAIMSFAISLPVVKAHRAALARHEKALKDAAIVASRQSQTPIATISYFKITYHFPNTPLCPLHYTSEREDHENMIHRCGAESLLIEAHLRSYFKSLLTESNSIYERIFERNGVELWRIK